MLSPLLYQDGRCYCHSFIHTFVADVKPHDWHVTATEDGTYYCQVADGLATTEWVTGVDIITRLADGITMGQLFYFILSSEVLNRTSSQMCGRCHLPMFLSRDGLLLTLIYRLPDGS